MKRLKVKLFLLIILVCLAFASAAYALRPFIFGIEKAMELHHDVEVFGKLQGQHNRMLPLTRIKDKKKLHLTLRFVRIC